MILLSREEKRRVATMFNLPQEIIFNILLRLPVKSLLRSRCVCKRLCNLISDPSFVKLHLSRAITETNNLVLMSAGAHLYSIDLDLSDSSSKEAFEINYPFKSQHYRVQIVGSCNGLICINPYKDVICLWNPCTKEYKKLPTEPFNCPFDCEILSVIYGFGYDPINDDYKVVRIVYYVDDDVDDDDDDDDDDDGLYDRLTEIRIYRLGTNSWRRVKDIPHSLFCSKLIGAFVNGKLHCVGTHNSGFKLLSRLIVSFDIGNEEFRVVPQPDYVDDKFQMDVGVLGGCLCIFGKFDDGHIDVWVMKDYGVKESWAKLFTIPQPTLTVIQSFKYLKPLCFYKNGEILLQKDNTDLVLYDSKCESIRNLEIRDAPNQFDVEIYVESLVSLKSGTYVLQEQTTSNNKRKKKKKKKKKNRNKRRQQKTEEEDEDEDEDEDEE